MASQVKSRATKGTRNRVSVPPVSFQPERFEVGDEKGLTFLQENGYVVFKDVATTDELAKGESLLWNFLSKSGVNKDDMSTWNWYDPYHNGIVPGQSEFLWYIRSLPKIKKIYETIWETEDLITSFDGCCVHRPWEHNESWKHSGLTNYHLDQNGTDKPGKVCVQGFLNFFESGPEDGGLCLVAKSHHIFNKIFEERPKFKGKGDWVVVEHDVPLWEEISKSDELKSIKVCCSPGDFVLWDSRVIHSGSGTTVPRPLPEDGTHLPLRRLVAYVCMTPKIRAAPEVIEQRVEAYKNGWTTSHWPEGCISKGVRGRKVPDYTPVELTPEQKSLIPISN